MDPELKTKWLTALRSGDYKQGTYELRTFDNNYCCLGVLADVSELGEWTAERDWLLGGLVRSNHHGSLPDDMVAFQAQNKLIEMNDHFEKSFTQIADWVEENL